VDVGTGSPVWAIDAGAVVALPRHGPERAVPAHLVDHRANLRAVCELGCDRVLALGSVGSLRPELAVGTIVCPDDTLALHVTPSFHEDALGHQIPGFEPGWRRLVAAAFARALGAGFVDGGVYAQTRGPRFETPAEVRMLARDAHLVGMTIAAESHLAREAGVAHAAICSVDNMGNGLEAEALTGERYEQGRDRTAAILRAALDRALAELLGGKR
jgi:5'-methylthioadenosine phosphorylase